MQKPSFDKCKEREFFYVYKYCIALVNFMLVRGIVCLKVSWFQNGFFVSWFGKKYQQTNLTISALEFEKG